MDRRIKYTKNIIRQTLLDLMQEKDITKITVTEICSIADINRATFYKYYLDVYDLLKQIEDELMQKIKDSFNLENSIEKIIFDVISVIKDNLDICKVLLGENVNKVFLLNLLYYVRDVCFDAWSKRTGKVDEETFNYLFTYSANGIIAVIQLWVKNGCNESVEDITSFIMKTTKKGTSIL